MAVKAMRMDPRLMGMVGQKLYHNSSLATLLRELPQNAEFACIRGNVTEKKVKLIVIRRSSTNTTVYCVDNGIGMTEEQLENDFMCLGNRSSAKDSRAVGGFGVAKAAIMRNPEWSCWSLNHYVNQNYFIDDDAEIQKRSYREGTVVKVRITDYDGGHSNFFHGLNLLMFSDVDIHVIFVDGGKKVYDEPHVGLLGLMERSGLSYAQTNAGEDWTMYGMESVEFFNHKVAGYVYHRIKGLVQFREIPIGDRKINLWIDYETEERPESINYPFDMSRENLSQDWSAKVRETIATHNENPLTASMTVTQATADVRKKSYELFKGNFLRGARGARGTIPRSTGAVMGMGQGIAGENPNKIHKYDRESLLFRYYNHMERNLQRDSHLLQAWMEILLVVAEERDSFGIGFIGMGATAMRAWEEGNWYYLVNPDVVANISGLDAQAMYLWSIACHEVTHLTHESHNEAFCIEMHRIQEETVESMMSIKHKVIKILQKM
jgi:hypothetical protein